MDLIKLSYGLFFLSGAVGLIYEVLWLRILEKITGSSPIAVSILLSIFMGGLGMGSLLGGNWAGKVMPRQRLIYLYGLLEGIIGLWALLIPILTIVGEPVLSFFYNLGSPGSVIYYVGCFLVSVFLILPPTFLMGITLPYLIQYAEHSSDKVGVRSGLLYGLNTAGGALGAIFAGFVGVPLMGTNLTLFLGVTLSLIIFSISYFAFRYSSKKSFSVSKKQELRFHHTNNRSDQKTMVLGFLFFTSGLSSLSFEIIWTNLLSLLVGPTTYSFTIVVSTYIIGIGLGSLIFSKIFKTKVSFGIIAIMQILMAFFFLTISHFIGNTQLFFAKLIFDLKDNLVLLWLMKGIILFLFMLPPTLISGGLFPLIIKALSPSVEEIGQKVGFIYALNTLGCILGSLLTGFLLLPLLGKIYSIKLLVLYQVIAVLISYILWRQTEKADKVAFRYTFAFGTVTIIFMAFIPKWDINALSYGRYHNFAGLTPLFHRLCWSEALLKGSSIIKTYEKASEVVFAGDGLCGFTVVNRYRDSAGTEKLSLITSGKPEASLHGDRATQSLLAHVPLLFHRAPKEVMVLGLASGMTAGEVLCYPVESVDVVEINPQVLKAARFFEPYNNNVLNDKRVNIILQDGRVHLTHTKRKYDVIISEPSNPWMAGLANLFSYEFFQKGRSKLKEDGIFLQWVQNYQIDWDTFSIICRTFFKVFKHGLIIKTTDSGDDYLLLGFKSDPGPDSKNVFKNFRYAKTSKVVTLSTPAVIGELIVSERAEELFGSGVIHTDSRPILEFQAPKLLYTAKLDVTEHLIRQGKKGSLTQEILGTDDKERHFGFYQFTLSVFQPLFSLFNKKDLGEENYERAKEVTLEYCNKILVTDLEGIEDTEIRTRCALTQKDLIINHIKRFPDDWLAMIDLGNALYILNDKAGAEAEYKKAMELNPHDPAPLKALGIMAMKELNWEEAYRYFIGALTLNPYDPLIYFNIGLCKYQKGLLSEAKEYLKKGLKLQEDPRARALLRELEGS